jgi:hypothetical protein
MEIFGLIERQLNSFYVDRTKLKKKVESAIGDPGGISNKLSYHVKGSKPIITQQHSWHSRFVFLSSMLY